MASSMSTTSPPTTAGLNHTLQVGLITLGLIALLSAASTVLLTGFICYRASRWHAFYSKDIKKNVFVVLLCNLFLADLFQALGFIFSWHWYRLDDIVSFTGTCGAQGFLINFGDVASAFFVLAIAGQTWSHLRFQRRLRFDAFVAIVVCIWIFALVLTVLGPVTSTEYFVDTGAWCWVDAKYKSQRLAYHYFWIFLVEFGTIVVYGFVIWELRGSSRRLHIQNEVSFEQAENAHRRIRKSCLIMCAYPVSYIALTLPLAVSRMIETNGIKTSMQYRIFCGSFLVSSGWVDCLLYVLTRASFLKSTGHRDNEDGERQTSRRSSPAPSTPSKAPSRVHQCSPVSMRSATATPVDIVHVPARMASVSSWRTNWSDTKTLQHSRAEDPFSTIDHDMMVQAARTLTLDAKVHPPH